MATTRYGLTGPMRAYLAFDPKVEEVVLVLGEVRAVYRLEVQLEPADGSWTDISEDVLVEPGIQWHRGIIGGGPVALVADPGTLAFSVDNETTNAAGMRGYYAPNHPDCRSGWTFGLHVRLMASYAELDECVWRGFLTTILPDAGIQGDRNVACTATDVMDRWAETPIDGVPMVPGDTADHLITAIATAPPVPLWIVDPIEGALVSLDSAADDRFPYAFMNMGDGALAMTLLANLAQSGLFTCFIAADGTFTTINRHHRALKASVFTIDDTNMLADRPPTVPSSWAGVYNRIRATGHQITPGRSDEVVLYASQTALYVDPGQTIDVWGTYVDQDNTVKLLGGTDHQVPIRSGTDYLGNSASDGSGSDLTADLVITTTAFASTVKFSIENTGASRVYLVTAEGQPFLQIRGRPLVDDGPVTVEHYDPQDYGDRPLDIDLPHLSDLSYLRAYAQFLVAQYKSPVRITETPMDPQQGDVFMRAALTDLEIGEVVTLTEEMTGVEEIEAFIQSVDGQIVGGDVVFLRYGLAPRQVNIGTPWLLEVPGRSELEVTTTLGF